MQGRTLYSTKRHLHARLKFEMNNIDKGYNFENNVLRSDEITMELFAHGQKKYTFKGKYERHSIDSVLKRNKRLSLVI